MILKKSWGQGGPAPLDPLVGSGTENGLPETPIEIKQSAIGEKHIKSGLKRVTQKAMKILTKFQQKALDL